jgi:hypothetical protein
MISNKKRDGTVIICYSAKIYILYWHVTMLLASELLDLPGTPYCYPLMQIWIQKEISSRIMHYQIGKMTSIRELRHGEDDWSEAVVGGDFFHYVTALNWLKWRQLAATISSPWHTELILWSVWFSACRVPKCQLYGASWSTLSVILWFSDASRVSVPSGARDRRLGVELWYTQNGPKNSEVGMLFWWMKYWEACHRLL